RLGSPLRCPCRYLAVADLQGQARRAGGGLRHRRARTLLQETMGDARLTAETLGHRGLGSVSGYTKITD
ncbi:MAG: hypothetical protein WB735_19195, partial [Pseudonocardiaceae bacterium]